MTQGDFVVMPAKRARVELVDEGLEGLIEGSALYESANEFRDAILGIQANHRLDQDQQIAVMWTLLYRAFMEPLARLEQAAPQPTVPTVEAESAAKSLMVSAVACPCENAGQR